jgi:hypothetical protein
MNRDNSDVSTNAFPVLSIFRGLYQRVAAKLGVDPSFVSRVARGERRSPAVLAALREEMSVIREHLNKLDESLGADGQSNGQQKDGKISNGHLLDGHLRDGHLVDGHAKVNALHSSEFVDGHLKDGLLSKPGKPNSKTIKSRQNKSKRNDGARAAE